MRLRTLVTPLVVMGGTLSLSGLDIYLSRASILPGGSAVGLFLLALAVGLQLAAQGGRIPLSSGDGLLRSAMVIFVVFLVWAVLGLFYTPDRPAALTALGRYLTYGMGMLILVYMGARLGYRRAVEVAVFLALLIVAGSTVVDFLVPRTFAEGGVRPTGILLNPNAAAQSSAMLAFVLLLLRAPRLLQIAALALAALAVFMTLSRSGIVLMTLVLTVAFLRGDVLGSGAGKRILLLGAAGAVLALTLGLMRQGTDRNLTFERRVEGLSSMDTFFDKDDPRVMLLQEYLRIWAEHPWIGIGTAATVSEESGGVLGATHNVYAKVLVENGLIGLTVLVLIPLLVILRVLRRGSRQVAFLIIALGTVLIWGIFTNALLDNRLAYFCMLALLLHIAGAFPPDGVKDDAVA